MSKADERKVTVNPNNDTKCQMSNNEKEMEIMKETKKTTATTNNVLDFNLATMKEATKYSKLATALANIEKYGFIAGVIAANLNGVEIPAYTMKDGTHVAKTKIDATSISDIARRPDMEHFSRSTVSRMVGAVRRLTDDNGAFEKFASGKYQFTYDKIYLYYDNKEVMAKNGIKSIDDAMAKSVRDLKELLNPSTGNSDSKGDDEEMVNFTYNKKTYSVKKSAMDTFLKGCKPIVRGRNK